MSQPLLIAIGHFRRTDIEAMEAAFDLHRILEPGEIADLDADVQESAQAVAYASHSLFGAADMQRLPALRIIAHFGAGYDSIDVAAATARGIRVTNTPSVLDADVADLAVAMYVMQLRDLRAAADWVSTGHWRDRGSMALARRASGRRVGICGLGRIGRAIADRLAAMRCEIHYHARAPKDVPDGWTFHDNPTALAAAVDAYFVVLVGGADTEKYISRQVIDAIGPDGLLVNVSRGTTVDEDALIDALQAGRLGAAALDVFLNEPDIDPRFMDLENVLLMPHIGSATVETRDAMGQLQRDNLAAFFAGRSVHTPVN